MRRITSASACITAIALLALVAFCSLAANATPPAAPTAGEEFVETLRPFEVPFGFPWIETQQPVPVFDTQGGTRELIRVELTLDMLGYSESRYTPYQNDAPAGAFLTRVFSDVTVAASSDSGDFVADPSWSAEGFVRSPDLAEEESSAWLPAMFDQASTQSVSGDLSMWTGDDGQIVDLMILSAGGNWAQAGQACQLQVDDTDILLEMTIAYVWRNAAGTAAPAPAGARPLPDRDRVLTRFVHHVGRQRAGGAWILNGTKSFSP